MKKEGTEFKGGHQKWKDERPGREKLRATLHGTPHWGIRPTKSMKQTLLSLLPLHSLQLEVGTLKFS